MYARSWVSRSVASLALVSALSLAACSKQEPAAYAVEEVPLSQLSADLGAGRVTFASGDMLDPALGTFDHVVAMDSLIHYDGKAIAQTLASLAQRTRGSIVFTIAPRTPALTVMLAMGRLFPRGDRSPAIAPISQKALERHARTQPALDGWRFARAEKVSRGFYISQAVEAVAP